MNVLYEDNHIIVVNKNSGEIVQEMFSLALSIVSTVLSPVW